MKIVILDGYTENPGDLNWNGFEELGNVIVYDRTPNDKIAERIGNAEIVILNKTPITKETLDKCCNIKYIGVLATGFNVIDTVACKAAGITVSNIPSYGTAAVAQFAIALLLEICHHVGHHSDEVYKGKWSSSQDWCFWDYPLIELAGKTIGIIGFGRIGRATGKIAKAMDMNVIAYDEYPNAEGNEICKYVDMEQLLEQSDVIALHCPLTVNNHEIICAKTIQKMKDGVIIINNSRGSLINEKDLADALNSGKVYAAGLDVVTKEPICETNPLLNVQNCFITPHISWAPKESRQRLMNFAVENCKAFINGNPINVVN